MKTCLQTFRAGVDELVAFLQSTEDETELNDLFLRRQDALEGREKELLLQITSARTDRKRYVYTVAIISLYGLLERFVDTSIEAFVDRVASSVSSYELMPEAIKRNHVPMSLELVKAIVEERHRSSTTQEDVIGNLHSCLSGATVFRVNGSAFVLHRGNISLGRITEFLTAVGITPHLRRVTLAHDLLDFFHSREPELDVRMVPDQELSGLLRPIDDLVERRNEVSHGVINIDDIESTELLIERCRFMVAYGSALYDVMLQEALKYQINLSSVQGLGRPVAVFNGSIVCFESSSCRVAVGKVLVAKTGDALEPFRYSPIISLEIDNTPIPAIVVSQPTRFGARVSFKASERYDYYVLPDGII